MASGNGGNGFDAQQMFELYLLDYFLKKNMYETAEIFINEADVPKQHVAIDVPDGFLREWWGIFHDIFTARQPRHQDFETEASEVEKMTESLSQVHHSMATQLASDHQQFRQFHISTDFDVIGEPAASLLAANFHKEEQFEHSMRDYGSNLSFLDASNTNLLNSAASSSRHPQRQICGQVQQQVVRDNLQGIDLRETTLMDPALYEAQRIALPMPGIPGAGMNGGVNPLRPNEWSLNAPNHQHQFQTLMMKQQPQLLAPTQSFTRGNLTFNYPESSTNFACQNLMLPRMNLSGKNAQMGVQMRNSGEHQPQHNQLQHQQLKESGRRRSKLSSSRAKDNILDPTNDKDKEPVDKKVESVPSLEVTVDSNAPSRIVKRKPATSSTNKPNAP